MRHMSSWCRGLLAVIFLIQMSGCVVLVAGTVGAVGGYALTRDTIQGEYDARYDKAFKTSTRVCNTLGTVTLKDSSLGFVQAAIDGASVRVDVAQLTAESVRIRVKARKGIFPRMGTAEKVYVKIVQELM